jgi:hypothetical protein
MTLILPEPDRDPPPSDPALILAFVADNIAFAGMATVLRTEDRLHERLRILREREQPADDIRTALALCAARRTELADDCQAGTAASPCFVDLKDV